MTAPTRARDDARLAISPATPADADWLTTWQRAQVSLAAPARPRDDGDRTARRTGTTLARCLEDGCVLLASGYPGVTGMVALDLDAAAIAELAFATANPRDAQVRALLTAVERLAVRFGLDTLSLAVPNGRHERFTPLGYRAIGTSGAADPVVLTRSLARRQTRYSRRISAIAGDLGISPDYGRRHRLQLQPEADRLASIGPDVYGREQRLTPAAARAWRAMVTAAAHDGIVLQAVSAFRDVDYQRGLVERKLARGQSIGDVLAVSAAPGYSEHHTGNAVDITTPGADVLEESFECTAAYGWLRDHGRAHGFRLSFPRDNRHGLAYEPWHWCFRG